MAKIRLQYVNSFRDRHGRVRHYFRRPGAQPIPLPGLPGSAEFMDVYQAALAGGPAARPGTNRTKPGTVSAAVASYYLSGAFSSLAPGTRQMRRNILERFRAEHGDKRVALLQRQHIDQMVAAKAKTPAAAQTFLKVLRGLLLHCVATGLRESDPTAGVKSAKLRSAGIYTWSEDDIAAFEGAHAIGATARLALALLLCTAQRRSDVVRMGRQHVQGGMLHVRQKKTGKPLMIPVLAELQGILDATPTEHLTFLTTAYGKPFSPAGFGNWFRKRCEEAGLPKACSAHGLRKAACRRLAEAGCSAHEIMAISGHASLSEVQRYCEAANQARLARAAMATVTTAFTPTGKRTSSYKPE